MFNLKKNNKINQEKEALSAAIIDCYSTMLDFGYDRINFQTEALPEDYPISRGGWQERNGYCDDFKSNKELEFENNKTDYQVSFLLAKPDLSEPKFALGVMDRVYQPLVFMPEPLGQKFKGPIHVFEDVYQIIDLLFDQGYTADKFKECFLEGVDDYNAITTRLCKQAGVYNSLKILEDKQTESDKVFGALKNLYK